MATDVSRVAEFQITKHASDASARNEQQRSEVARGRREARREQHKARNDSKQQSKFREQHLRDKAAFYSHDFATRRREAYLKERADDFAIGKVLKNVFGEKRGEKYFKRGRALRKIGQEFVEKIAGFHRAQRLYKAMVRYGEQLGEDPVLSSEFVKEAVKFIKDGRKLDEAAKTSETATKAQNEIKEQLKSRPESYQRIKSVVEKQGRLLFDEGFGKDVLAPIIDQVRERTDITDQELQALIRQQIEQAGRSNSSLLRNPIFQEFCRPGQMQGATVDGIALIAREFAKLPKVDTVANMRALDSYIAGQEKAYEGLYKLYKESAITQYVMYGKFAAGVAAGFIIGVNPMLLLGTAGAFGVNYMMGLWTNSAAIRYDRAEYVLDHAVGNTIKKKVTRSMPSTMVNLVANLAEGKLAKWQGRERKEVNIMLPGDIDITNKIDKATMVRAVALRTALNSGFGSVASVGLGAVARFATEAFSGGSHEAAIQAIAQADAGKNIAGQTSDGFQPGGASYAESLFARAQDELQNLAKGLHGGGAKGNGSTSSTDALRTGYQPDARGSNVTSGANANVLPTVNFVMPQTADWGVGGINFGPGDPPWILKGLGDFAGDVGRTIDQHLPWENPGSPEVVQPTASPQSLESLGLHNPNLSYNPDTTNHDWQHLFTVPTHDSNGHWAIQLQGEQANSSHEVYIGIQTDHGMVYVPNGTTISPDSHDLITAYTDPSNAHPISIYGDDLAHYEGLTDKNIENFYNLNTLFKQMTPHHIEAGQSQYPSDYGWSTADSQDRNFANMGFGHAAFVQAAQARGYDVNQGPLFADKLLFTYQGDDGKVHVIASMANFSHNHNGFNLPEGYTGALKVPEMGGAGGNGSENIFQQGWVWLSENRGTAAAIAAGVLINSAVNARSIRGLITDIGTFREGRRVQNIVALAAIGLITVANPGLGVAVAIGYLGTYPVRVGAYIVGGAIVGGIRGVRSIVTGGTPPAPPAAPAPPVTSPGTTAPPPPAGTTAPPSGTTTVPPATGGVPGGGVGPAARPFNAVPLAAPVAAAARNFGNNPGGGAGPGGAGRLIGRQNNAAQLAAQLAPAVGMTTGAQRSNLERQVAGTGPALQDAIAHQRDTQENRDNAANGRPLHIYSDELAADIVVGERRDRANPLDMSNETIARAMAEAALSPLGSMDKVNELTDAIRRTEIAMQAHRRLSDPVHATPTQLQSAMHAAQDKMQREVDGRHTGLTPEQEQQLLIMQATALRNAFMERYPDSRRPAGQRRNRTIQDALNASIRTPSGAVTQAQRAIIGAAVNSTHAENPESVFNGLPYEDTVPPTFPTDQRHILAERAQGALEAARVQFGAHPTPQADIDTVLSELRDAYQATPYLGENEEQLVTAIGDAIQNMRGATFEQKVHAVAHLSTTPYQKAQRAAGLVINPSQMYDAARVLRQDGVDSAEIWPALESNKMSRGGGPLTPVEKAILEATLNTSTDVKDRIQHGILEVLGAGIPNQEIAEAIVLIYSKAGVPGMAPDVLREALQMNEFQALNPADKGEIARLVYQSRQLPTTISVDDRANVAFAALGVRRFDAANAYRPEELAAVNSGMGELTNAVVAAGHRVDVKRKLETQLGFTTEAKKALAEHAGELAINRHAGAATELTEALRFVVSPTTTLDELKELIETVVNIPGISSTRADTDVAPMIAAAGIPANDLERRAMLYGGLIAHPTNTSSQETLTAMRITDRTPASEAIRVAKGLMQVAEPKAIHDAFTPVNSGRLNAIARTAYQGATGTPAQKGAFAVMVSGVDVAHARAFAQELQRIGGRQMTTQALRESMQVAQFDLHDQLGIIEQVLRANITTARAAVISWNDALQEVEKALAAAGIKSRDELDAAGELDDVKQVIRDVLGTPTGGGMPGFGIHASVITSVVDGFT